MRKPMYTVKPFGANDQPLTYFRQRSWSLVGNDELTAYRSLTTVWLGDLSMTKARKLSAAVVAGWAVTAAVTVGPVAAGAQGPTSVGGSVGTTNAFEAGATGPIHEYIVVHFKSLVQLTPVGLAFIDTQLADMRSLYAEAGIDVRVRSTEDLSSDQSLFNQRDLNVAPCIMGGQTTEHRELFAHRNGAAGNDIVVYIVGSLDKPGLMGCASHPAGQPGAVVTWTDARWLVAHEVGHVLGLYHPPVANSARLMDPQCLCGDTPPTLTHEDVKTMVASDLSR